MADEQDEVTVKIPAVLVGVVELLAARARAASWGEFSFGLKAGKPSGFWKFTESGPINK